MEINLKNIKLVLIDVDGTLTDGGMYYTKDGDIMKKFYARDGMGIKMLKDAGIKVGIVTGEQTEINDARAKKLGLDYALKTEDKYARVKELLDKEHISVFHVAYIGDDVNDIELLGNIGFPACPCDAAEEVVTLPSMHIMNKEGGHGCVRELCDMILKEKRK